MRDDIWRDFDALLWLRSKQGQYAGYEKGSQDNIRHLYFKASADELESLRAKLASVEKDRGEIAAKLGEAVKLFEGIRQFVGQEVDGASSIDLLDVEIAIDKWCGAVEAGGKQ